MTVAAWFGATIGWTEVPASSLRVERTIALQAPVGDSYGLPRFSNGMLTAPGVSTDTFLVYSSEGKIAKENALAVPHSSRTLVYDVAAALSGAIAVGGGSYASQYQTASGYLLLMGPNGAIERLISTEPYVPVRVCFADDGTLWTAGRERTANFDTDPEGAVMRHYSAGGVLLRSAVPAKTFGVKGMSPAVNAVLVCGHDRVGLYSMHGAEWVEVDQDGVLLGRWPGIPNLDDLETAVLGGAFTATGDVYISRQETSSDQRSTKLSLYMLDKTVGQWIQVDTPSESSLVVGSDGEHLVLRTVGANEVLLEWARVIRR